MAKRIKDTLLVISEKIRQIDIDENDIINIVRSDKFFHIFDDVKDFRQEAKVVYKLSDLLMISFLTILINGKSSYLDMEACAKHKKKFFENLNLLHNDNVPSHDTFRYMFSNLNSDYLLEVTVSRFYDLLLDIDSSNNYRQLCIDGKDFRASGRSKEANKPLENKDVINVYDPSLSTCILSLPVDNKGHEISGAKSLLEKLDLNKTIISADALHCQIDTIKLIKERKGHYVITVKDNQSLLIQEIIAKFNKAKNIKKTSRDKSTIELLNLPNNYEYDGFESIKSFIKLTSNKRKDKECIRYFISDMKDVELIADVIDNRWSIENDLHKEKDLYLKEDYFRSTDKVAINNMAIINNFIMQLVRLYSSIANVSLKEAKDELHYNPIESLTRLIGILDSDKIINELKTLMKKEKQ